MVSYEEILQMPEPWIWLTDTVLSKTPDLHSTSRRAPGERREERRLPKENDVGIHRELLIKTIR